MKDNKREKNIDFFSHQLIQYVSRGRCKMRNSILGEGLGINEAKKERMLSEGVEDRAKWKGVAYKTAIGR